MGLCGSTVARTLERSPVSSSQSVWGPGSTDLWMVEEPSDKGQKNTALECRCVGSKLCQMTWNTALHAARWICSTEPK